MPDRLDTVVVGAGQAGLAASCHLSRRGIEHVVLERGLVADTWRTKRWDTFYLNTPRWTQKLPGAEYAGPEPEGFGSLAETISYLEGYAAEIEAPVRTGTEVKSLRAAEGALELSLDGETLRARNVVVATGAYQAPTPAPLAERVPADVFQLHTSEYRRPEALPEGGVLIVGGGQSGCQIAEELLSAGRTVYLSIGRCPWLPRRYRGREMLRWLVETGFMDQKVETLPSPAARLGCNPPISGNDGGHDCHPRWLEARGAILLGRLVGVDGHTVELGPDLAESLAFGDQGCSEVLQLVDAHIAERGIDAPAREPEDPRPPVRPLERLDLREAGVGTILWSTGYRPAFQWIELPLLDEQGWPRHVRGVTEHPGLYFVGLHWLHTRKSSLFLGVGEDAEHVVAHLAARA